MPLDLGVVRVDGLRFSAVPDTVRLESTPDWPRLIRRTVAGYPLVQDRRQIDSPASHIYGRGGTIGMAWQDTAPMTQDLHDLLRGLASTARPVYWGLDDHFGWEDQALRAVDDAGVIYAARVAYIVPINHIPGVAHDWEGAVKEDGVVVESGYTIHADSGLVVFDSAPTGEITLSYRWRGYCAISEFEAQALVTQVDNSCGKPLYAGQLVLTPVVPPDSITEPAASPGLVDVCYSEGVNAFRDGGATISEFEITVRPTTTTPHGSNDWSYYRGDYVWPTLPGYEQLFIRSISWKASVGNSSGYHPADQIYEATHGQMPTDDELTANARMGEEISRTFTYSRLEHSSTPTAADWTGSTVDWRFYSFAKLFGVTAMQSAGIFGRAILDHVIAGSGLTIASVPGSAATLNMEAAYDVYDASGALVTSITFPRQHRAGHAFSFNVPTSHTWRSRAYGAGPLTVSFAVAAAVDATLTYLPLQAEVRFQLDAAPTWVYDQTTGSDPSPRLVMDAAMRFGGLWTRTVHKVADPVAVPDPDPNNVLTDVQVPSSGFWPYQLPWTAATLDPVSGIAQTRVLPEFQLSLRGSGSLPTGTGRNIGTHLATIPQPTSLQVRPVQELEVLDPRVVLTCRQMGVLPLNADNKRRYQDGVLSGASAEIDGYAGSENHSTLLRTSISAQYDLYQLALHPDFTPEWYETFKTSIITGFQVSADVAHVGSGDYRVLFYFSSSAALPAGWPTGDINYPYGFTVSSSDTRWTKKSATIPICWELSELTPTLEDLAEGGIYAMIRTHGAVNGSHVDFRRLVVSALFAPGLPDVSA